MNLDRGVLVLLVVLVVVWQLVLWHSQPSRPSGRVLLRVLGVLAAKVRPSGRNLPLPSRIVAQDVREYPASLRATACRAARRVQIVELPLP